MYEQFMPRTTKLPKNRNETIVYSSKIVNCSKETIESQYENAKDNVSVTMREPAVAISLILLMIPHNRLLVSLKTLAITLTHKMQLGEFTVDTSIWIKWLQIRNRIS